MDSTEDPKDERQDSDRLKVAKDEFIETRVIDSLPWEVPPLCLLSPEQQVQFRNQAQIIRYTLGEKIWSTETSGEQFVVVAGKVRLREEGQRKPLATLGVGEWFGDRIQLLGSLKAVASDKDVVVVGWNTRLWVEASSPDVEKFWNQARRRIQPQTSDEPQPVSGYPFVSSLNTAAACLTMVAWQLQVSAQLDRVQRQLRGQRPREVVEVAEKLGLQLRRLQVSWSDLRQLPFPALVRWNLGSGEEGHGDRGARGRGEFEEKLSVSPRLSTGASSSSQAPAWVVVYGVKGDRLIVANPLNPEQTCESIPKSMVDFAWDGQLWQVELIQKQDKFNLSWFLPAVWHYRGLLGEVLFASFTLQILGLTTPIITQVIIDKVMVQESLPTLDVMALALLLVALFEAFLGMLRLFIFTHTARRLDLSLSAQVFRHLLRLPLAYFEARRVGDTVARVQELENIRQFLTGTALTVILDSIFAVVYLALMFYYNIQLTWVALAVIPLFALLTIVATPILRTWLNETFNRSADSQSFLVETITGIHAVKAHGAERTARDRWEGLFARFIRTGFKASTTSNISNNIGDFLTNFSNLLILWFGAKLVIDRKFTIGQLIAFQMLSGRMTGPLLRLVQLWQNLQQVLLSVDRIGDILNVSPEAEPGSGLALPSLKGQVTFDQVFFRYRSNQEPILRGISFTVEPGMFVGIVGRSGSGKSTLSKLLQRLYQPESGRILIDGFDLKSADLASLRQQIGVVLQEDFLFNASILENITLGNPDITAEQVVEAARLAVAHDFISEMPQGYETNVGERGTALSGGQRQRVALARLFLSQTPILILDEATSALDSETEQQVLQNLQVISRNRTVFLIAHRFAPLKRADLILVLEKGVLAEQGTHDRLLQQKGLYWSLYQRQQSAV
jgi:ATP-binding cassette subfamily B protein